MTARRLLDRRANERSQGAAKPHTGILAGRAREESELFSCRRRRDEPAPRKFWRRSRSSRARSSCRHRPWSRHRRARPTLRDRRALRKRPRQHRRHCKCPHYWHTATTLHQLRSQGRRRVDRRHRVYASTAAPPSASDCAGGAVVPTFAMSPASAMHGPPTRATAGRHGMHLRSAPTHR